jgi:hypothetical protein
MSNTSMDLFAVDPHDPMRNWGALIADLEKHKPSPLKIWIGCYEEWKHCYQRFRDYEQHAFFTGDHTSEVPVIGEDTLRMHKRALFALLSSGERTLEVLLSLDLDDEEEARARMDWRKKIDCLLESLQEALELWHPVNRERADRAAAFAKSAA